MKSEQTSYSLDTVKYNEMTWHIQNVCVFPCRALTQMQKICWKIRSFNSQSACSFSLYRWKMNSLLFFLSGSQFYFPVSRRLKAIICAFTCFYLLSNLKLNKRTNKAAPPEPNHPRSISLHVCESVRQLFSVEVKVHNWAIGQKALIFVKCKSSQRPAVLQADMYTHRHTYIKFSIKVMSPRVI